MLEKLATLFSKLDGVQAAETADADDREDAIKALLDAWEDLKKHL